MAYADKNGSVSSVYYYNGTVRDGVVVQAPHEYQDLMLQLSTAPKQTPTYLNSFMRWLNKRRGLPSTPNVGIIGDLVKRLKEETETELAIELDRVVVTHPHLPGLSHSDIGDALEFAGLKSWLHEPNIDFLLPKVLTETQATFGANGYNLCKHYKDFRACNDENLEAFSPETVYFVSLERAALYTTLYDITPPFGGWRSRYERYAIWPEFGMDRMAEYPSEEEYWDVLHHRLIPEDKRTAITVVLLAGEGMELPKAREAVFKAKEGFLKPPHKRGSTKLEDSLENYTSPLFAASRGAALYASWRQEVPYECAEGNTCELQRKRERAVMAREMGLGRMRGEL